MPQYKYVGDEPVDLTLLNYIDVKPGDVIDVPADAGLAPHPHFQPVDREAKAEQKAYEAQLEADAAEQAEPDAPAPAPEPIAAPAADEGVAE